MAFEPRKHEEMLSAEWRDCEIHQTVTEVRAATNTYVLRTQFEFVWHGEAIIIAQTSDETAADWICAEYPQILDIFTTVRGGEMNFSASVCRLDSDEPWTAVVFKADFELRSEIVKRFPETRDHNLLLWRSAELDTNYQHQVSLMCDFELPLSDPYFYWTAPHPVWLKRLHADVGRLMPYADGRLWSAPKLARRPRIRIDNELGTIGVEVNGMVLPGQSIDVRWDGK